MNNTQKDGRYLYALIAIACLIVFASGVWLSRPAKPSAFEINNARQQWEIFKLAHNCKLVHQAGGRIVVLSTGEAVMVDADEQTYFCDGSTLYTKKKPVD